MAIRQEELTSEESAQQRALNRSWANAQRVLADAERRYDLERSIERVNTDPTTETLSGDDFLDATTPSGG